MLTFIRSAITFMLLFAVASGGEIGNVTFSGPGTVTCPVGYNCQMFNCDACTFEQSSQCEVMNTETGDPGSPLTESLPCACCKAINCNEMCTFEAGMVATTDATQAPIPASAAAVVGLKACAFAAVFAAALW